jgi:lipoyl(octanoyl) transferase
VTCSLEGFDAIVPCGITGRPVGRLADRLPDLLPARLRPRLLAAFERRFGLVLRAPGPGEGLEGW